MTSSWFFTKAFYMLYLVFFSWIAALLCMWTIYSYIFKRPFYLFEGIHGEPLNPFLIFLGALVFLSVFIGLTKLCGLWDERIHKRIFFIGMGVIITAQLCFTYIYQVEPSLWDFGTIFYAAKDLAKGTLSYSDYFEDYTNNLGITFLLSAVFRISSIFGDVKAQTLGLLFNIFMIDLALVLLYLTARRIFGTRHATMVLIISLFFTPFITYAPIYYTDTLSLPMSIGMLYGYTLSKEYQGIQNLFLIALSALIGTMGVLLKPSIFILFLAILLHILLTEKITSFLKKAVLILGILVIGIKMFALFIDSTHILSIPFKQAGFPYTHWVMMGLSGPYGFYNASDVQFTESFLTKNTRKEANLRMIKERVNNYGIRGLFKLYSVKNLFVWGDGTYFAPVKLDRGVPKYTKFHKYILPMNTNENRVYIYLCQMFDQSLILLLLLSGAYQFANKKVDLIVCSALAVLGIGLFMLLWEARSRYLIHFAPMILLCSVDGLVHVKLPRLALKPRWKHLKLSRSKLT
jgi:hypothetical protein